LKYNSANGNSAYFNTDLTSGCLKNDEFAEVANGTRSIHFMDVIINTHGNAFTGNCLLATI
jgi:hypothetical protein